MDNGDFVVVTNIDKIKFSGKKFQIKNIINILVILAVLKVLHPDTLTKNKSQDILKLAVKRMLPGGPLAKKQLTKLKIYKGLTHPHQNQNPKIIDFKNLNKKNEVRN